MRTRLLLPGLAAAALVGGLAAAQERLTEAEALVLAKRQADEATERSRRLERQAAAATSEAAKARAAASALIARIEAAEADITAAETRIRIIDALRVQQRASCRAPGPGGAPHRRPSDDGAQTAGACAGAARIGP